MGGQGSGRINRTDALIRKTTSQPTTPRIASTNSTEFILPNRSGDFSTGKVIKEAVSDYDIANKAYVDAHGGGGSQTPWTQNINAAGFTLSNAGKITGSSILMTGDISGSAFYGLGTGIDHSSLSGSHNLTTDIDHNALTNYEANRHINWTNATQDLRTTGTISGSALLISGNFSGSNIYASKQIRADGNISGSSLYITGNISGSSLYITGNISGSKIYSSGDISGSAFYGAGTGIALDTLANPLASKTFNFGNNKSLTFTSNDNTPTAAEGSFNFEATGAFAGSLVHIHQHTGNPSATDLLTLEATDADVMPLRISGSNAYSIIANKDIATSGNLSGSGGLWAGHAYITGNLSGSQIYSSGKIKAAGSISGSALYISGNISGSKIYSSGEISGSMFNCAGTISGSKLFIEGDIKALGCISGSMVDCAGTISGNKIYAPTISGSNIYYTTLIPAVSVAGVLAGSGISTQTASFNTTSGTYVDVTNPATLTISGLNSNSTYTCVAWFCGMMYDPVGTASSDATISIDGTDGASTTYFANVANDRIPFATMNIKTGITGKTSIDIKGRLKTDSTDNTTIMYNSGGCGGAAQIIGLVFKTA